MSTSIGLAMPIKRGPGGLRRVRPAACEHRATVSESLLDRQSETQLESAPKIEPRTGEPKTEAKDAAILYVRSRRASEQGLDFHSFDAGYIERLSAGHAGTQDHFVRYFTALIRLKLRSKLRSPQAIEDVCQETFARVIKAVRQPGAVRQPERFGAFVNTVCNHVLHEHYRFSARGDSLDDEGQPELPSKAPDALHMVASKEMKDKVGEILRQMPERDRKLLHGVFFEDQDRDELCAELSVNRVYLRTLLLRAKLEFKAEYLKRFGDQRPFGMKGQEV